MMMSTKQLYKISGYIQNEGLYVAQVARSGINMDRTHEKLEQNPEYLKTISMLMKFFNL